MQSPSSGIESVHWSTNSMPAQWSPSNKPAKWPAADQFSAEQPLDLTTAHQTDVTESRTVNNNTAG